MENYTVKILIPKVLSDKEEGMRLLSLVAKHFPNRRFTRFGDSEPLKSLRYPEDASKILEKWGHTIFIGHTKHRGETLHVHFCPVVMKNPRHSLIILDLLSEDKVEESSVVEFINETCTTFGADYGMAHILTKCELNDRLEQIRSRPTRLLVPRSPTQPSTGASVHRIPTGLPAPPEADVVRIPGRGRMILLSGTPAGFIAAHQASGEEAVEVLKRRILREGFSSVLWSMFVPKLNTGELRKGLPDLYWINVFGPPYVRMFNRETLLKAPVFETRELTSELVMLRLVPSFTDEVGDWNSFKIQRQRCKEYLGMSAFRESSSAKNENNTPCFEFPVAMYKTQIGAKAF